MTRQFRILAWVAVTATYLLIVLGAIVRITGSGMGCGDDWPLCNGHVFPPLDDIATVIEWAHRLLAAIVSVPVFALAVYAWWLRRKGVGRGEWDRPSTAAYWALGLLIPQALLGAITVKLELPHWTVVLHFMMANIMFAALLIAAVGRPFRTSDRAARAALGMGFLVLLLGALTAKLGAAGACVGFPLCNGQIWPTSGGLATLHWIHRLVAYLFALHVMGWAFRSRRASLKDSAAVGDRPGTGPWIVLGLVLLQVVVAAGMVSMGFPASMQALHAAVGVAVWAGLVLANTSRVGMRSGVASPAAA